MVHCRNVPPDVREFFQRDIDRTKKATAYRARERLRREKAAAEGNYPGDEEDEEAQVQRAMDLSRAEAEFRRGVMWFHKSIDATGRTQDAAYLFKVVPKHVPFTLCMF